MIDTNSPTWIEISEFLSAELSDQMENLETPVDIDTTQFIRGYIRALRNLHALPHKASSPMSDAGSHIYN
jgi:hypothetical protein